ncbi:small multidrug efflux protein [Isoptericola sp. NEAU-Y5]|uniref:Small multidrug efflux protein n=1 Tax=Isoptericola luteus TaxID=2879484 RepID=A0ABS7ZH46_9MICO|nr:small multidrug efflux protein [Isoptericola sp. NEAU-Y5]MCA5893631.1 small multidrug efflux protein [Isoptericola sp. NEAU-Y5]
MNPVEQVVSNFQQLVAQVPEVVQPLVAMLAGAIPFVDGEVAAMIGVLGGIHPVLAAVAAATGNFVSVLVVVAVTSRTRSAVVGRRRVPVGVGGGPGTSANPDGDGLGDLASSTPVSKGRRRLNRWLVRFGVPGASVLGPLAIPGQFTAAILVGSGTPRRWVLLWQAVSIVLWTSVGTVSAWAALAVMAGAS